MKTKHTPGPWDIEKRMSEYTVHTPNMDICSVYEMDISAEEGEANAKLIAASPDLLEALIAMKNLNPNHPVYAIAEKLAEDAIKKALS